MKSPDAYSGSSFSDEGMALPLPRGIPGGFIGEAVHPAQSGNITRDASDAAAATVADQTEANMGDSIVPQGREEPGSDEVVPAGEVLKDIHGIAADRSPDPDPSDRSIVSELRLGSEPEGADANQDGGESTRPDSTGDVAPPDKPDLRKVQTEAGDTAEHTSDSNPEGERELDAEQIGKIARLFQQVRTDSIVESDDDTGQPDETDTQPDNAGDVVPANRVTSGGDGTDSVSETDSGSDNIGTIDTAKEKSEAILRDLDETFGDETFETPTRTRAIARAVLKAAGRTAIRITPEPVKVAGKAAGNKTVDVASTVNNALAPPPFERAAARHRAKRLPEFLEEHDAHMQTIKDRHEGYKQKRATIKLRRKMGKAHVKKFESLQRHQVPRLPRSAIRRAINTEHMHVIIQGVIPGAPSVPEPGRRFIVYRDEGIRTRAPGEVKIDKRNYQMGRVKNLAEGKRVFPGPKKSPNRHGGR